MLARFLLATSALLSLVSALDLDSLKLAGSVVPNRYIVEFDSAAHLQASLGKRAATPHEYVYRQLQERGVAHSIFQQYDTDVFIGASITLDNQDDLAALASVQGVLNISPVRVAVAPQTMKQQQKQLMAEWGVTASVALNAPAGRFSASFASTLSSNSGANASVPASKSTTCSGNGRNKTCSTTTTTSGSSSTSSTTAPSSTFTGFGVLDQIAADKIQAAGNKGKGIKIAVVDSGVDYTRTPLGGCFGPECKIAKGYDFVGDGYNATTPAAPGPDPMDQCFGHGTYMAGIIGADPGPDNIYGTVGVAPEATQYAYRIFGCSGYSTYDLIMAAMQQAYKDGADIINLSLGDPSGWTEDPTAVLASRLTAKGIVISISTGNSGQAGAFFPQKPGNSIGPIAVGAVNSTVFPAQNITYPGYGPISYLSYAPFPLGTYPIVALTNDVNSDPNTAADGCGALPNGTDFTGQIVLLRPGGCPLGTKGRNVFESGAQYIWFVTGPGGAPEYLYFPIETAFVPTDQGNFLISEAIKGNATVDITFNPYNYPNYWSPNQVSYFSSMGPTFDLYQAVQILAPGTNIVGLQPTELGNWTLEAGTSCSAAFVSGAAALYLNAQGNSNASPKRVREAFQSTAIPMSNSLSDSTLHTLAGQGSGRFQLANALNSAVSVSPTELLLNDTANFQGLQYITIKNNGGKQYTFNLQHKSAETALTYAPNSYQANPQDFDYYVTSTNAPASVWLSQKSVTLWPGQSTVVVAKFTPPSGLNASQFPIYSGYIQVSGGPNTVNVQYLGVAAKMKDMHVLDPSSAYTGIDTPVILGADGNAQSGSATYTFQNGSYPTVLYRQAGGSPLVLIDLVDANAKLPFTPNYNTRRALEAAEMDARELRPEVKARVLEQRAQLPRLSSRGGGGLLSGISSFICQITHNSAPGCNGSGTSTFHQVPILGNLYQAVYTWRNEDNQNDNEFQAFDVNMFDLNPATFSNGTTIPNGTYRFLLRALHVTGDARKEADYEAWLSMPFTVAQ